MGTTSLAAAQGAPAQRRQPGEAVRYLDRKEGAHEYRVRDLPARPHVFLVCLDMVSPDHYLPSRGLMERMEMPALRALMADGTNFSNAFCTISICAPSRASLYTGRQPYVLANPRGGQLGMETSLRANDVIFPEYLKAAGYQTKHAGKNHTGARKFMDAFGEIDSNWDRAMPAMEQDEGYISYLRGLGVKLPRYSREIRTVHPDRKSDNQGYGGWIVQSGGKPFPLEGQYSHYLFRWGMRKLDDALENRRMPVYLQINIYDPHKPFTIPAGFERREAELRKAVSLPASYREWAARGCKPGSGDPLWLEVFRRHWGFYRPQDMIDYMVANALAMEVIDRGLGDFVKALKERGVYDDSLIILTADHGEMNGHLGIMDKGCYIHPDTQRVPFVVKPPARMGSRGRTVETPVSLLDVASTVLDIAGIEPGARQDGISLLPCLRGETLPNRELLFQTGWQITANPACGSIRWEPGGQNLMFVYNSGSNSDELYDLNDPDPQNLAGKPGNEPARMEMARRMAPLLRQDPRFGCFSLGFHMAHFGEVGPLPRR